MYASLKYPNHQHDINGVKPKDNSSGHDHGHKLVQSFNSLFSVLITKLLEVLGMLIVMKC